MQRNQIIKVEILTHSILGFIAINIISVILAFFDGWAELAQHYKTKQPHPEIFSLWELCSIGGLLCRLNIGVCEQGIYLSGILPMRLSHPPLLIPWDAITKVHAKDFADMFEQYVIYIGNPHIATLSLPKKALKAAETILETKNPSSWRRFFIK